MCGAPCLSFSLSGKSKVVSGAFQGECRGALNRVTCMCVCAASESRFVHAKPEVFFQIYSDANDENK